MTLLTLARRSLTYHLRAHLGVLAGATIGSAALIGALIVGDSVRHSLRETALQRIGKAELALVANDRFFRAELADDIANDDDTARAASLIVLPGTATASDASARANQVQINGVDRRFWDFARTPPDLADIAPDQVVLNEPLARQLDASVGDTILLRFFKPSLLSRDTALAPQDDVSTAARLEVSAIVADDAYGRFSLRANQIAPYNAFVNLDMLSERIEQPGRANLMLVEGLDAAGAGARLKANWQLEDVELELREIPAVDQVELRTSRVFLDPPKVNAALKVAPAGQPVLTYFANEISSTDGSTPYSMIAALGEPLVPEEMSDDEIIINEWLAEDLGAEPGDEIRVRYYELDAGASMREGAAGFTVRSVVPMTGLAADPNLMPPFPGVADAEETRDWNTGFELEVDRIRDKDEDYWDDHRGTPKAFITRDRGVSLWSNRFGEETALRWSRTDLDPDTFRTALLNELEPASVGLNFEPVRERALAASSGGVDFGGLFIGFSLFLIAAALLLMALLFKFGVEQRAGEMGTLLAMGFRAGQVRRLLLWEGGALAFVGSVLGAIGGHFYARAMLLGLTSVWSEAIGGTTLLFHASPASLVGGVVGGTLVGVAAIWFAVRRQAALPARVLLAEGAESVHQSADGGRSRTGLTIGVIGLIGAAGLTVAALQKGLGGAAPEFFGVGALLLIAGLAFVSFWFQRMTVRAELLAATSRPAFNLPTLGLRSCTRRGTRSIATIALLASGTFLIVAIAAFRLDAEQDAGDRASGTGGFALIGESALPVAKNLNTTAGREFYGLRAAAMEGVEFVSFRVRAGDDASCLNLNMAQNPRLIGVDPTELARRDAFTFAQVLGGANEEQPWLSLLPENLDLDPPLAPDEIPAIGDANSIKYALQTRVGASVDYTDEQGRPFRVRLVGAVANSILQGNLVIAEQAFLQRFPSESGHRMFLIDAPSNAVSDVSAALSRGLSDAGLELTPAVDRLNAFNAVQNTYLGTFQVLGGLGLLLGSVGLGVVVLRNVLERRGELGLMMALGFRRRELQRLILGEHGVLLVLGLFIGLFAAVIAILPALIGSGAEPPWRTLPLTLVAVLLNGVLWTWIATRLALRGELLAALRNE